MPAPASPVVAAWDLAVRLRQRRREIHVEVRTITERLGFTRNYWSAIENFRTILSEDNLLKVCEILKFNTAEQEEILELRRTARSHGWWEDHSELLDDNLQRLYGLEAGAKSIRTFETLLIPGLLQTDEYATAVMMEDDIVARVEIGERVRVRLRRQERLTGDNPLQLHGLISEAALHQQIGGPAALRRQLQHLVDLIEQLSSTLELRVIPFSAQPCGLFTSGTIHILEFESRQLMTVAWLEPVTAWGIIDNEKKIRDIDAAYRQAAQRSLDPADSLSLIKESIRKIG